MKKILFFVFIIVSFMLESLAGDSQANATVYIRQTGKYNTYRLVLFDDLTFEYSKITKSKGYYEKGKYQIKGKKLFLYPEDKSKGFSGLKDYVLYMQNAKIYANWSKAAFKKDPLFEASKEVYVDNFSQPANHTKHNATNNAQSENNESNTESATAADVELLGKVVRAFYRRVCQAYLPKYVFLIDSFYCGPDTYSSYVNNVKVEWNGDTAHRTLIDNFGTIIHESAHNTFRTWGNTLNVCIPSTGESYEVPYLSIFSSEKFKKIVPIDARERIFRFKTYVDTGVYVTANVMGIYGLLDELTAYAFGTEGSMLLGNKMLEIHHDTTTAMSLYKGALATAFARYEFNLFIAWYLHYASLYEKDIYNALMKSYPLRYLYYRIDDAFEKINQSLYLICDKFNDKLDYTRSYYQKTHTDYSQELLLKEQSYLDKFKLKARP
ncbi:MAG: hypothetical protein LC101_08400 [Flavobacteriales bacterium]|nr:hypothetical protein [Flavobacteriales bacterium]